MEIIWDLILQRLISSYRRIFFGKIMISYLIFILSMIYILFILIKVSFFLKGIIKEDLNIDMFSLFFIVIVTIIDLTVKLFFYQVKIADIYPYLRLNIQRRRLADYLIILNYFNAINIIGLLLLIPITIVCINRIEFTNIVFILLILTLSFLLNNHISLILNIMRIRFCFLMIFSSLFFILIFNDKLITFLFNAPMKSTLMEKGITFLILIFLMVFSYSFLRKKIVSMLYIK